MIRQVVLTHESKANIAEISSYIAKDSADNARSWRRAIREHMRSLAEFPERCEIAFPAAIVGCDVRHTFFGVYRILCSVESTRVVILAVRHGARRPMTAAELRRSRD